MWNNMNVVAPVHDVCEYHCTNDRAQIREISNFITVLSTAADTVGTEHAVWAELKLFQAVHAKLKFKLPCEKLTHVMHRVGQCLRKFVLLSLSKIYLDLAERFLRGMQTAVESVCLPSRQQLEFLLIRTYASAKLIAATLNYARHAFLHLVQRLRVGHLLNDLLMICSALARLTVLFKALLQQLCNIYRDLKPWCTTLKEGTWKWESKIDLPANLWDSLAVERAEETDMGTISQRQMKFLSSLFEQEKVHSPPKTISPAVEKDGDFVVPDGEGCSRGTDPLDYGEVVGRQPKRAEVRSPGALGRLFASLRARVAGGPAEGRLERAYARRRADTRLLWQQGQRPLARKLMRITARKLIRIVESV